MEKFIEIENQFGAHNYHPLPVVLTRGERVYLWDVNGKRYMDMMSAYSAISHGHCHPRLVAALTKQAQQLAVCSRAFYSDKLGAFLQKACELTQQDCALAMNSGAEAVETALKAARKWGYQVKGVAVDKAEIVVCDGNFHGRTIAIVGMSAEPQYKNGFGPFPAGFNRIPYGDVKALEAAITPNTVAFLVEPLQGEAGIVVPPPGYLKACADICRQHNVLFIADEIQSGLGRTGKLLACDHENIKPDGLILGKALGGGLMPVSLFLSRKEVMNVFTPGDHGSTFGGSPLAAAVGLEALNVLLDEQLTQRASELGDFFMTKLRALQSPLIKEVRGKGLLIGLVIDPAKISARKVCLKLVELGLLSKETHETVIRLAPPLVITKDELEQAFVMIEQGLESLL